jgi:poly-beta-1,6 N-acetyl-D-glucosamine synthase
MNRQRMNRQQRPRSRWAPAPHWVLVGIVAFTVAAGLLLQGYARNEIGRSSTQENARADSRSVAPGNGSVIYTSGGRLAARSLPAKTVALTFDDGPDPRWTPQVLDVLAREHVPATFFDVGSRVAGHPDLVRRELAGGNEVGSHTFTHAALSSIAGWRENLELSMTQLALAGATGHASVLVRPPYSSTPDAVTPRDLQTISQATHAGYLVVLADRDSEDWTRPGWLRIVANSLPPGEQGAIVMFHDGGGNRAETVQALPHLIQALKARGYRFTTVTAGLGLATGAGDQPVSRAEHLQGLALLWALSLSGWLAAFVTWFVAPLGALALLWTLAMAFFAHRYQRVRKPTDTSYVPPVSVIVPAYNEAVGIESTIRSLVASDYPSLEVVVIDDGSTDGTADIVEALQLPGVRIVRQPNGGKATALNTGIAAASYDVLVLVDGDTVFQPDTVRMIVQQMRDPAVGAVAGNAKVGNRNGLLGRWQHLEYVVGFNLERRMFDLFGSITTVPGAVGAFRRQALEQVGGVSVDTLAEDTDLTMAILRAGFRVVYEPRAVAWTEAPATFNDLWRQRYRWCYGTIQSVWKHRHAVVEAGPGRRLGWIGLPTMLAFRVVFPLVAPALDLFAIFGVLFIDPVAIGTVWVAYTALTVGTAAYALRLDGESVKPLWALPLQQFFYRQIMYLVVIQSVISAVSGVRLRWHKLHRTGDMTAATIPVQVGERVAAEDVIV